MGDAIPLVWVRDGDSPAAQDLTRQVAAHVGASATGPPELLTSPGAFGARQRAWLTRLTWPHSEADALRVVVRSTFMDRSLLASWEAAMPEDAVEIPLDAGGLVDGLTPQGETAFYAVFAGPEPWRPLPLSPVLPPFDELRAPLLLGDVASRLAEMASSLDREGLDATATELVEAALRVLGPAGERDHAGR
jgi:hypothetical protein